MSDHYTPEGMSFVSSDEILNGKHRPLPKIGRIPPQAIEMEQAVLGAILLESGAMDKVEDTLRPEMFYKEGHRVLYACMADMSERRMPIDLLTVRDALSRKGHVEAVGGMYYMTELTSKVASAANIEYHSKVIMEKWVAREGIKAADQAIRNFFDETKDPLEEMETLRTALDILNGLDGEDLIGADSLVEPAVRDVEKAIRGESEYVKFGFTELDGEIALSGGDLVVVAARPAMGKTAFGVAVSKNAAKAGVPTLFVSLDTPAKEVISRDLASSHDISGFRMRTGKGMEEGGLLLRMTEYAPAYKGIDMPQKPPRTLGALTRKIRAIRRKKSLPSKKTILVVIDYLQLMKGTGSNREQEVASVSRGLKEIAVDENCIIMALTQLNRATEATKDKKPNMANLRESGQIEQDADMIIFLHRPEYYEKDGFYEDGSSTKGIGHLIFAKMRFGVAGDELKLAFQSGQWRSFHPNSMPIRGVVNNDPFTMPIDTSMARHKQDGQFENDLEQFQERYNG